MVKNLSKVNKALKRMIALAATFYFEQFFVFCELINRNVLEWFLLIMCKKLTLKRSTNVLIRNHTTLCFWLTREYEPRMGNLILKGLTPWKILKFSKFLKCDFLTVLTLAFQKIPMKFTKNHVFVTFFVFL